MKLFVLYDGRALHGDTDRAAAYVTADTEEEALRLGKDPAWKDGIWFEYDCATSGFLEGEKMRPDLPPFSLK